ncbi:ComF family protein [Streptomyces sp. NPDC028635]|uniref:ComF family protein n=1 Tax=Streptomyces sp. NPDC028635 TaxID=3154800 RepID=UPI00341171E0
MRGWWQDLTDLVLPVECAGCGRPRAVLCPECRTALSGAVPCRVRPEPQPPGLPAVHAAAPYADEVRALLLAHKERGVLALARPLGEALAAAVRAGLGQGGTPGDAAAVRAGLRQVGASGDAPAVRPGLRRTGGPADAGAGGCVLLVPVPSARAAVRARGHDPARRIALAAAGELRRGGMPVRVAAVLRQRRAVADQAGLDSRERLANLSGALAVVPGGGRLLAQGPVVLVDDLMTTGASLGEAARAVRDTGVSPVYPRAVGEGREEREAAVPEGRPDRAHVRWGMPDEYRAGRVVCAAVVAASPDAFEINRN